MSTVAHDRQAAAPPLRHPERLATGLALALLSAFSFGQSGALGKGLMGAGWTAGSLVLVRVALGAVILAVPAYLALRGRWHLLRRNTGPIVAYGTMGVAGCQLAYFNAVNHLTVGVALLIEYSAPAAVIGWLWLRYGQRPGRVTVAGALVCTVGLLLVLDLLSGADLSVVGVVWALVAMVGAATYFVLSAELDNDLPPVTLAGAGMGLGALVLAVAGLVGLVPMTAATEPATYAGREVAWWLPLLALGVVTAALAYWSGIMAARRLGSRLASFVALTEVLAALLFAWLLLAELPQPIQFVGGALIVGGVLLVKAGERVSARPAAGSRPRG